MSCNKCTFLDEVNPESSFCKIISCGLYVTCHYRLIAMSLWNDVAVFYINEI